MDNELFKLYVLAELSYKKHFSNLNDDELFPSGWYGNKNYQKKPLCAGLRVLWD